MLKGCYSLFILLKQTMSVSDTEPAAGEIRAEIKGTLVVGQALVILSSLYIYSAESAFNASLLRGGKWQRLCLVQQVFGLVEFILISTINDHLRQHQIAQDVLFYLK